MAIEHRPDWAIIGIGSTIQAAVLLIGVGVAAISLADRHADYLADEARRATAAELERELVGLRDRIPMPAWSDQLATLSAEIVVDTMNLDLAQARQVELETAVADARARGGKAAGGVAVASLFGGAGRKDTVYLEALSDGLVVQPAGRRIALAEIPTLLPDAIRGAPHVTILVRPSGHPAFSRGREAIERLGTPHGFLPVRQDWKLIFPPARS